MNERKLFRQMAKVPYKLNVYFELKERAVMQSADYVEQHLGSAMIFQDVRELWKYSAQRTSFTPKSLALEFGVFKGTSINFFADLFKDHTLHGFDSFEGLAEDWTGYHLPKGTFDQKGQLPKVRDNVSLHKGWFDQTLPPFLKQNSGTIKFCHIDCDTYESSKYVLETVAPRLKKGSVIIFDEYLSYPNWQNGEFKAWQETCKKNKLSYQYIAFATMQAAVVIK